MEEDVVSSGTGSGRIKGVANVAKAINEAVNPYNIGIGEEPEGAVDFNSSEFKVCKANLPVKPNLWTKVRSALLYEVKVELTPYQQKVEDDINKFLHQEITWAKTKSFLFQEVKFGK